MVILYRMSQRLAHFRRSVHLYRNIVTTMADTQDSRPPGRRQRQVDQLKMLNFSMTVDEENVVAVAKTHGLVYFDYDAKSALPKPWHLMKLLESARFYIHHWPLDDSSRTFRDYAELTSDRLTFLVSSVMDINKNLYDLSIPKAPLNIKVEGGYIGNTSLNSVATAVTEDGDIILSNTNQIVSVSKETRRPLPLPEAWKTKYAKSAESHTALKFAKYTKPDDVVSFKLRVVRSDLDSNNHTNWSCYVRYSLDAMYHVAKKGGLPKFPHIDEMHLKRMELLYSGESFDEDVLDVYVWEHDGPTHVVHSHIYKEGTFLFQGTFKYFESENINSTKHK